MITVSYDKACPPVAPYSGSAPSMRADHASLLWRAAAVLRVENDRETRARRRPGADQGARLERQPRRVVRDLRPADLIRLMNGIGAPKRPKPGFDMAGIVEAVGPNVTLFKPGDEVFGGVGGAFAEYVARARERAPSSRSPRTCRSRKPAGIPIAAITALQGLRDQGHIAAGQKVLINGASGGVGTYAVQIAKALGAEVTGVCSTRNVEMVRSLGADHVVDYTKENFTEGKERYDLILDNVGNHGFSDLADVMKPDGVIVVVGGSKKGPFLGPIKRVAWSKLAGTSSIARHVLHREREQGGPGAAREPRARGQAQDRDRPALSTRGDRRRARIPGRRPCARERSCHRQLKASPRWSRRWRRARRRGLGEAFRRGFGRLRTLLQWHPAASPASALFECRREHRAHDGRRTTCRSASPS